MTEPRYRLSFTTGGLLVRNASVAAPLYQRLADWAKVRAAIDDENLLQARTIASGRRIAREVVQRLSELTDGELDLLTEATASERGHLMWVAACRRYALVGEFAEEVLRERFQLLIATINYADYDAFVRSKAIWHDELASLKDSTYRKLRANAFLMVHEAGLLSDNEQIIPAVLSDRVGIELTNGNHNDLRFFPATQAVVSSSAG